MTREEAIKVLENASIEPTWGGSFRATREALTMAIDALKCKPTVIRCKELLSKEDFEAVVKRIHEQKQNVIVIPCGAEVVSTNTSTKSTNTPTNTSTKSTNTPTNTSTKSTNISTDASADRPRGEWIQITDRTAVRF